MSDIDRVQAVQDMWPLEGPHTAADVRSAAAAVAELVRYLNHATFDSEHVLRYASEVYDVLAPLSAATSSLPQLLGQLSHRCEELAADPSLITVSENGLEATESARWAATDLRGAVMHADSINRLVANAFANLGVLAHTSGDQDAS